MVQFTHEKVLSNPISAEVQITSGLLIGYIAVEILASSYLKCKLCTSQERQIQLQSEYLKTSIKKIDLDNLIIQSLKIIT